MTYLKKLEKLISETEEIMGKHREKLREEIGEFEHPELEAAKPENSEGSRRHAQLLEFYQERAKILKSVQETLNSLNREEIDDIKEKLDKEHPRSFDKWDREAKKSNRASLLLENAAKLVEGKDYDPKLGNLESKDRYPETDKIISEEENEELNEIRERYIQAFLNSSSILNKKGRLEQSSNITEKDIEEKEKLDGEIEEIRDELKQRAEDINAVLCKSSKKLKKLEN
jgi:hypothetical protein